MPRLDLTPITQKDIKDYLTSTEDEFRLELETYNACKISGVNAVHGGTYEDPVTKKTRQYDIRAFSVKNDLMVQFAIECKCLKPFFPLLIFQTPKTDTENYHEIVFSYEPSNPLLLGVTSARNERFSGKYSLYRELKFIGKNTAQVGKNSNTKEFIGDDSEVFEKWSQALGSAHDLIAESTTHHELYNKRCFFTLILPILVVSNETLWAVNYSAEGAQEGSPKKVDETVIYIGKDYWTGPMGVSYSIPHIHVLTLNAFKKYIHRFTADDPNEYIWDDFFPSDKIAKLRNTLS